jgi:hypothetical protein
MAKPVKVRCCRATVTRFDPSGPSQGSPSRVGREARSPASTSYCDHLAKRGAGFAILPFTARPESVPHVFHLRDGYEWGPPESAPFGRRQPASGLSSARYSRRFLPVARRFPPSASIASKVLGKLSDTRNSEQDSAPRVDPDASRQRRGVSIRSSPWNGEDNDDSPRARTGLTHNMNTLEPQKVHPHVRP